MRCCINCKTDISASRKGAVRCPECRLLHILGYVVKKKRKARSCRVCGEQFRSAGDFDMTYCAACLEDRPLPAAMTRGFNGRVAFCGYCAERGTTWWATEIPRDTQRTIQRLEKQIAIDRHAEESQARIDEIRAAHASTADRLALDHRVPLCAACAKDPVHQAAVVAWLEGRARARRANRDTAAPTA